MKTKTKTKQKKNPLYLHDIDACFSIALVFFEHLVPTSFYAKQEVERLMAVNPAKLFPNAAYRKHLQANANK